MLHEYEVTLSRIDKNGEVEFLRSLSIGSDSLERIYNLAKQGIPESKQIDFDWGLNADILFDSNGLRAFLKGQYPDWYESMLPEIQDEYDYRICCVDLS